MKIAGGMFGLEPELRAQLSDPPPFMRPPYQLFLSARCAMDHLIRSLKPPQVWLPSYLCCSMLEAIDRSISTIKFFPVGYDLSVASLDWLEELVPGSLVVLIDYFGFPCDAKLVQEIQARGSLVLEDASQALLSAHVGLHSDFVVYSPRKFVGVPEGGILRYQQGHTPGDGELLEPPHEWWLKTLEACLNRREFDKFGGTRKWYELFQEIEATYPVGPFRMSKLSEVLLLTAFDYDAIACTRRKNFLVLADKLSDYAIYKTLDEQTVPLGFPITLLDRDRVRQVLFEHQIYPPVHWKIDTCIPANFVDSHILSRNIMTIPCDQRLDSDDVLRIANTVLDALRSGK